MTDEAKLKICFMGGRQAGLIGALTAMARGHSIVAAVCYDEPLTHAIRTQGVETFDTINTPKFVDALGQADVMISVHGREIVQPQLFNLPAYGAVNVHPYLYKYKGSDPVSRAFQDGEFRASVGSHIMTEQLDCGRVLVEEFLDVSGSQSVLEIYNRLYPVYSMVVSKALDIVAGELQGS